MQGERLRAAQVEITGQRIQDIRDANERLWSPFGSKVCYPNQTFHLNQDFILLNPNLITNYHIWDLDSPMET